MHDFQNKAPVYKINSVTTPATNINKVANFGCIAQAINHHPLKKNKIKKPKKKTKNPTLLHFLGISLFFIFSCATEYSVQLCIKNLCSIKNLSRKIKTYIGPTSARCRSSGFPHHPSSVVVVVLKLFPLTLHKYMTLGRVNCLFIASYFKY